MPGAAYYHRQADLCVRMALSVNAMSVFDCSISRTDIEPTQRESKRLTYKLPNGASFQAV